ncbi:MAG: hypothetical protein ABSE46_21285 [Terracidiphilus sp.]
MKKLQAPSRIASVSDASTSTSGHKARTSSSAATAAMNAGLRAAAGQRSEPRDAGLEPLSCVVSLRLDDSRLYTCPHCGDESKQSVWTGTLTDSLSESNGESLEIAVLQDDDTPGVRAWMQLRLATIAYEYGYTDCEVRDYSHTVNGGYVPLYGGAIPALKPAF